MTSTDQPRKPGGSPEGGQFAGKEHADAHISLAPSYIEEVDAKEGMNTPWGRADNVDHIATGLAYVSTPSHGGFRLSKERNRDVPAALRSSSRWYEEDGERKVVAFVFPDEMGADPDEAEQSIRSDMPHEWEKMTGEKVPASESPVIAREEFNAAHAGQWKVRGASTEDDGSVRVWIVRDGDERQIAMSHDDYTALDHMGSDIYATDDKVASAPDITPPPAPEPEHYHDATLHGELTPAQKVRADKDLDKMWRGEDGEIVTLREVIEKDGVLGRHRQVEDDGKVRYFVYADNNDTFPVSASTWKALSGIPGNDSPKDDAMIAYRLADVKYEKARFGATSIGFDPSTIRNERAAKEKRDEALRVLESFDEE